MTNEHANPRAGTQLAIIAGILATILLWQPSIEAEQDSDIIPSSGVQSLMAKVIRPTAEDMHDFWRDGKKPLEVGLSQLLEAAGGRHADLIPQLLYYNIQATNTVQAMGVYVIIDQMKISKEDMVAGLLPWLESKHEPTRKTAARWLGRLDLGLQGKVPDFARYEALLRQKKQNPPQGVVRYMFDLHPEAALVTVARVYGEGGAAADVSAKMKNGAKEAIRYFAERPEWWAQLYVVAELQQRPELGEWEFRKKVLRRLHDSEHPLVREKLLEIKGKND